jgi:hypothetical protein
MMTYEALIEEDKRIKDMSMSIAVDVKKEFPEKNIIWDGVYEKYLNNYINTKPHILWILKEAPETDGEYLWDCGDIDEKNPNLEKEWTLRMMCLISYAILKKCNFEIACKASTEDLACVRQQVAHINLCKIKTSPGKYSEADLSKEYNKWKNVLDAQIKAYKPEIIICGNTLQYFSNDNDYFGTKGLKKNLFKSHIPNSKMKFCYYSKDDKLIMNIYQPLAYFLEKDEIRRKECINEIKDVVLQWDSNKKPI